MDDESQDRLKRLIFALQKRVESNLASALIDLRIAYADLTQDERRLLARWVGDTSLFEEDATSIRVDITVEVKFSGQSSDDEPRATSMSVCSDAKTVEIHLRLPLWLDELTD
jgi:hypothetical protein